MGRAKAEGKILDPITNGELYVGFLNFCTMLSSNYALNFVSYPM